MIHGRPLKTFLLDLNQELSDDNVFNGAAALGFFLTLALFPAMILLMTVIPYLPIAQVDQAIMDMLGEAMPEDAYRIVEQVVKEVTSNRRGGLLSFGILATWWAASSGMHAVMRQLNITYNVKEERNFIYARAVALGLSLIFGVLIISAFSLIVLGGILQDWIASWLGNIGPLLLFFSAFRWVVIVLALLLAFAIIYRFAPNVEQRFAFITPGSVAGVILLIVASLAFAIYTQNFANYDATYGSIGAMIILMLWLYITGLVLLVGSEVNSLLEHYSSEGKRKGERKEGNRQGEPLHKETPP